MASEIQIQKGKRELLAANAPRKEQRERIHYDAQNPAPIELRLLARLDLKRRQLLHELAGVMEQYQELTREIESKKIPVPWLPRDSSRGYSGIEPQEIEA